MSEFYFVEKITGTPADTLLAFGLAELLVRIAGENDTGLKIIDAGDCYRLELTRPLESLWIENAVFFPLFRGLDTAKKAPNLPPAHRVDYVEHQRRNQEYFNAREKLKDDEALKEQGFRPPVADWPAWAVINQMSAVDTYNKLAEIWYAHKDCFPELLTIILGLYQERPNLFAEAESTWKKLAARHKFFNSQMAQLQVVNPGMGKGGNRSKASGLSIGGLKGFWVPEYLKFAGLFQAAIPRIVKGEKDRKTYVLRPKELRWDTHLRVFPKFRETLFATSAIQMDIMATLHYCRVFLEQWKAGQDSGRFRFGGNPGDHVNSLDTIFYKYLGSAYATLNLSTLVLPEWLNYTVETNEQADQFLSLVTEHQGVTRNLNEKHGDEYSLLQKYRDFLSARDLRFFFEFTRGYARYVMSQLNAGGAYPPRQFSTPNLEVLIMAHNKDLKPILENEGFLKIASAIRSSTVTPQYFKAKGQPGPYEIRYGLGSKLLRGASYPGKFTQALSKFIQAYMRENAQINERFKGNPPVRRPLVRASDIEAIVGLIDEYDSETIANLLVAYGYAHDPKSTSTEEA